jgi:CHAD domain-containing protein
VSYRFERDEEAGAGVRRIVLERLEHAREQLENELKANPEDAVHTARKDLKKARSTIRLVRAELGKKGYRRDNDLLRDAGRELSDVRDATVTAETLEQLREHFGKRLGSVQREAITAALRSTRAASGGEQPLQEAARAIELIDRGSRDVGAWKLPERGWELLEPGLRRSYRRGRDAIHEVEAEPTPEAVHEWRKRVKDLWYHLRLLEDTWSEVFSGLADQAHELSSLLGDHHDLTVIALAIDDGTFGLDARQQGSLRRLLLRRQSELLAEALPLGRRLYAEKPKAFARRLEGYWDAWRGS